MHLLHGSKPQTAQRQCNGMNKLARRRKRPLDQLNVRCSNEMWPAPTKRVSSRYFSLLRHNCTVRNYTTCSVMWYWNQASILKIKQQLDSGFYGIIGLNSRFYGIIGLSSKPVRNTRKLGENFSVKNVVLTHCQCAHPPLCICMHKNDHVRTLKIL